MDAVVVEDLRKSYGATRAVAHPDRAAPPLRLPLAPITGLAGSRPHRHRHAIIGGRIGALIGSPTARSMDGRAGGVLFLRLSAARRFVTQARPLFEVNWRRRWHQVAD